MLQRLLGSRDFWSGILTCLTGAVIVASAATLGLGRLSQPGAGFFGFYVGWVIAAMGVVIIAQSCRASGPAEPSIAEALKHAGVVPTMLLPMLAFCLCVETIGFVPAAFLLMWWLFGVSFGKFVSLRPILYAAAASLGTYGLFELLLHVGLPRMPL